MEPLRTIERGRTVAVLLSLAATALVIFTAAFDQFLLPKYVWVKVLTAILAVLTLARSAFGGDVRLRLHRLNLILLLFVLWKAVSWFWAQSPSLAADNIRWWATLLLWCLLFQDWLGADRRRLQLCAGALMISALLLSLWVLIQDFAVVFYDSWMRGLARWPANLGNLVAWVIEELTRHGTMIRKLPDWRGFLSAGLGNTNHIADYLALLFPAIAMMYLTARGRLREILSLLALVASAAALVVCWSVGSNGGLILAGLAMFALLVVHEKPEFWRRRLLRIVVLLVLLAGVIAFYVFPHRLNPHRVAPRPGDPRAGGIFRQAFDSERWHAGWPTRVAIWLTSIEMIKNHALLGIGAGNFTYGYTATLSPAVLTRPDLVIYAGSFTNAAHNEPLQAWVETGIVGLVLLLMLWGMFVSVTARRLGEETNDFERRLHTVLFAAMVAFIAHSMMNFTLQLPTSSLMFVAMVGAAATLRRHRGDFRLGVRQSFRWLEIDLETTGMRRIESVGFKIEGSRATRIIVVLAVAVVGTVAVAGSVRLVVADIHFKLAKEMFELRTAEAEQAARRAIAINAHHHHAWKLLARVLLRTGRYAAARRAFERAAERETVYDFFKEWGEACWRDGDREAAGRAWATYFERFPQAVTADAVFFDQFSKHFPRRAAALLGALPDGFFKAWGLACWTIYKDRAGAGRAWAIYFSRRPAAVSEDADLFELFSKQFPEKPSAKHRDKLPGPAPALPPPRHDWTESPTPEIQSP